MSTSQQVVKNILKKPIFTSDNSQSMNKYMKDFHYLESYKSNLPNSIRKLDHADKNEISSSEILINPRELSYKIADPYSHIRVRLQDDDAIKKELQGKPEYWGRDTQYWDSLSRTQYFAEGSGDSQLFLENPPARQHTQNDKFGMFPCSGGVRGTPTFYKPGSKVSIQWQIQNPVEGGKCVIKMAPKNSEFLSSYTTLTPTNFDVDENGYFDCGKSGGVESAEITIPDKSTCSQCTLQLAYKAPGVGEIFQCTDITTVKPEGTGDCKEKCQNGGICFKGDCICAKGYYGLYCEESTSNPGAYVTKEQLKEQERQKTAEEIFGDKKRKGKKNNGINYLEHTPEAELPSDFYNQDGTSGANGGKGGSASGLSNDGSGADGTGSQLQFIDPQDHDSSHGTETDGKSGGGFWSFIGWYFLWLFLALIIAAIICAVLYYMFKREINLLLGNYGAAFAGDKKDKDEEKGRDRSDTRQGLKDSDRSSKPDRSARSKGKDKSKKDKKDKKDKKSKSKKKDKR